MFNEVFVGCKSHQKVKKAKEGSKVNKIYCCFFGTPCTCITTPPELLTLPRLENSFIIIAITITNMNWS